MMGLMKEAGLEVRVDAAGNIFGRRAGTAQLPTLLFGSHIDSLLSDTFEVGLAKSQYFQGFHMISRC